MPIQPENMEDLENFQERSDIQLVHLLQAHTSCVDRIAAQLAKRGISVEYEVLTLNTQPVPTMKINPSAKKVLL